MMSAPTYVATTILSDPYVMKGDGEAYEGFLVDILDKVAEKVGFYYLIQPSKGGQYGSYSNGQWSGMIGEVVRREANIGLGDVIITRERERVVDFSKPYLTQTLRLLVKKPRMYDPGLTFLLEPFSVELWFYILFALLLVAILFVLIGRFNPFEWRQVPSDKDPRGARHSFGLRESFMFVFSTITLQGYRETPRSLAGRVLAVSWFIFVFFTVVAYIGAAVTFMLAGERMPSLPFEDLEDIVNGGKIQIGMVRHGSAFKSFKTSKVDIYQRVAAYVEMQNSFVNNTAEGIERVRRRHGNFVMIMESLRAEYITERQCDVMVYGKSHFSKALAFFTIQGSGLKQKIDDALLTLKEDGTMHMLKEKWWKAGFCGPAVNKKEPTIRAVEVTVRRLAAPFLLLLAGAILAVVVLLGEIVFRKLRQ
ncbi:glutamate receptor ionotropic, kainate 1-like [Haliotis rubra]|uniref:glutamate receptor ionotropic, kainate 1-like n=1 Tax=Haliotis rubra TaxID=36100 RepID=UPI001EE5CEA0|nr:glutamate receptor ionotropic, kainate 1-like [Haliotis rubra]XP_046561685.1 glutamate receptor ionotropic, kainate 1-like [Haliotis rubra]